MKLQLGKKLLAELMAWDDSRATEEFAWLKLIVEYKYDHYQGYAPGARFFVHFLSWISQFEPKDREIAYGIVRQRLLFISQREMLHLVSLTMPWFERGARKAVAYEIGIPIYQTWSNPLAQRRVKETSLWTLYVGLSDGAKTDVFRRFNEGVVSNEQIVAAPEIAPQKWEKLIEKLAKRLKDEGLEDSEAKFERICLIDDFTASGSTLIRKDDDGSWSGKIPTFFDQIKDLFGKKISSVCKVHVHHYLGTAGANEVVSNSIQEFGAQFAAQGIGFNLSFSMVLPKEVIVGDHSPADLVSLLKSYYSEGCETSHTKKDIWFGYKQCGLPLALDHNTPNNSFALLWASSKPVDGRHDMRPLFPRKQRHIDHGQSV